MIPASCPPDQIRIGPLRYQVILVKDLRDDQTHDKLRGEIVHGKTELRLDPEQSADGMRLTIWREIMHGILSAAGLQSHNERLIDALAAGVMGVLRDNPWLGQDAESKPERAAE